MAAARMRRCSPYLTLLLVICVCGYAVNSYQQSLLIPLVCVAVFVVLRIIATLSFWSDLAEQVSGRTCPGCDHSTLRRITRARDHFECVRCGGRYKRAGVTAPWEDASGPEDAAVYKSSSRAGRWTGYTPPAPGKSTTSGLLLRNKRMRNPSLPYEEDAPAPAPVPKPPDSLADPWVDHQVDAS